MCNSKTKSYQSSGDIDGRHILQPACNRILAAVDNKARPKLRKSLSFPNPPSSPPPCTRVVAAKAATKRCSVEAGSLNSSTEKPPSPKPTPVTKPPSIIKKKPKNNNSVTPIIMDNTVLTVAATTTGTATAAATSLNYKYISSFLEDGSPGSLAAAHRERAAIMKERRKMRIAHYGRATSSKTERKVVPFSDEPPTDTHEEKRCTFITPNSDPAYVAYHDEEWGVPVYDDRMLFELLVMSGAQVGLDWTTILKKRDCLRAGFCGFDPEAVSNLTEKQMARVSEDCGIDLVRVRGVVDNSKCILKMKDFGTFAKYLWGFVNNKPLSPQYRSCRKIPAKTSKAESISKDMVSRGFRFVGPTVVHSFMQAAGLTNDHLVTCPRHSKCHHVPAAAAAASN